jgi:hypothetical protein
MADAVNLDRNIDTLKMKMFVEAPVKQKRMKADASRSHIQLVYALPNKDPRIVADVPVEMEKNILFEKNNTGDTLDLWLRSYLSDSLALTILDGNTKVDAYTIHFPKKVSGSSRGGKQGNELPVLNTNLVKGGKFDPSCELMIHSNTPVNAFNADRIILLKGKDTLHLPVVQKGLHDLKFSGKPVQDSSYTLLVLPGAVSDWNGKTNDTLKQSFTVENEENYSALKIKAGGLSEGSYIVQLLDDKGNVLKETGWNGVKELRFEHLHAGQFRLKLIVDANANGKWDSGNYLQRKQPEQVMFYNAPIKLRTGWDLDVDWKFQ